MSEEQKPGTSLSTKVHERGGADMKERRQERMLQIEDEILQTCMGIVQAHLAYQEVDRPDPANPERAHPPESWIAQYGQEAAERRLAVAETGWYPSSKEPSGSVAARQIMVGIAKARGQKAAIRPQEVNVKIALPAPTSASFPSQDEVKAAGTFYPSRVLEE